MSRTADTLTWDTERDNRYATGLKSWMAGHTQISSAMIRLTHDILNNPNERVMKGSLAMTLL